MPGSMLLLCFLGYGGPWSLFFGLFHLEVVAEMARIEAVRSWCLSRRLFCHLRSFLRLLEAAFYVQVINIAKRKAARAEQEKDRQKRDTKLQCH